MNLILPEQGSLAPCICSHTMNKIEDILDDLLKESPELIENKNSIRKMLLTMEENNPEIIIDSKFKEALKNKLEIQNYAKLKNTQNKQINIAEKWAMSFKKDADSIFEKPKLNILKLLAPVFVWCFGMFWFFHFFWDSLFTVQDGWELEYSVDKQWETSPVETSLWGEGIIEPEKTSQSDLLEIMQGKELKNQIENDQEKAVLEMWKIVDSIEEPKKEEIESTNQMKESIAERIKKRNAEKSIERKEEKQKAEDAFTKILQEELLLTGDDIVVEEEKNYSSQETSTMNIENSHEDELLSDAVEETSPFEWFCEDKWWILADNICTYWETTCSEEDFENNLCE